MEGPQIDRAQLVEATLATTADGVLVVGADGRPVFVNEAARRIAGRSPAADQPIQAQTESLGLRYPDGRPIPPEETPLSRALQGETIKDFAFALRRPNGEDVWLSSTANPIRDSNGQIIGAASVLHDVTEQRRVATELAEKMERLRLAQQAGHVGTFDWNLQTGVIRWTPEFEALYGLPPGGLASTVEAWEERLHPEDQPALGRRVRQDLDRDTLEDEWRAVWPDGSVHWLAGRSWIMHDPAGVPVRMTGVNIDITERKQAEVERERLLGEVERRAAEMEAIVESMTEGLVVINPSDEVVRINHAAMRMLGLSSAEEAPDRLEAFERFNIRAPDGSVRPSAEGSLSRALRGESVDQELLITAADGVERRLLSVVSPVRDEEGQIVLAVAIYRDVTRDREAVLERERLLAGEQTAHAEAEKTATQLKALLANLGEGVTVVDAAGRIVVRNEAAREILGMSDEARQKCLYERQMTYLRLDGVPTPFEDSPLSRAARGEQFTNEEGFVVRPDGSRRRILVSGSGVRDEQGRVVLGLIVFRDVTELRQLELMKEDYVSLISHDLRNPLTVVMGQSDWLRRLLLQKGLRSEATVAESLLKSARRMNSMIQDLVDSARLESGRLEMHLVPTDLVQLVSEVTERVGTLEERARIHFEATDCVPPVASDPDRLERALVNLITNALKYSPPDRPVNVRVERVDGEAVISVTDHGSGIPPEDLPYLFERLYQAKTGKKVGGGLGLGLYITRLIVQAHGGRVWVETEVGKGSTFGFSLPLA